MAGTYSTVIERGATWERVVTWTDEANQPVDLTGYTARMQVRDGADLLVELSTAPGNGRVVLGGAAGTVTLRLTAAETAALPACNARYDLFLTAGAAVTRLLAGTLAITPQTTV